MGRRVLMITAAWPPVARIGARRPLRLARRLESLGWSPVVLTPTPASVYGADTPVDANLVAPPVEVHRVRAFLPSWSADAAIQRATRRAGLPLLGRLAHVALRDARFVDRFSEWTPGLLRAARRVDPVDAVWVTGRPFGLFPGAALTAAHLGVPLMLDYRDHWTNARLPARRHPFGVWAGGYRRLERALLQRAQAAAFVNQEIHDAADALSPRPEGAAWGVIPNGFDPLEASAAPHTFGRPTLVYAGGCYHTRSMKPVLEALAEGFGPGDQGLQLVMHGELDPPARAFLAANPLPGRVHIEGRIGADEIIGRLKGAAAQLLIIGETHGHALSGKIFDYFMTGRPILGVGPGDAAARAVLAETGTGGWATSTDRPALIGQLKAVEAGTLPFAPAAEALDAWSADRMAARTATLLDRATR